MSKKTTLRLAALASALALGGCVTPGGGTISTGRECTRSVLGEYCSTSPTSSRATTHRPLLR